MTFDSYMEGEIMYSMAASHARGKRADDNIFAANGRAIALADRIGKDKVINGTVGSLLDDEGNLVVYRGVQEAYKSLSPKEFAAYAPISGYDKFKKFAVEQCFGKHRPSGYVGVCAIPGGSGALRQVVYNYAESGDDVLITDWHWTAYDGFIKIAGRNVRTFKFLNDKGVFNAEDFQRNVHEILEKQDSIVIILNGIANNPTGYSMTVEEWQKAVDILKKEVRENGKRAIIEADVAYMDYAGEYEKTREFFKVFDKLPKNILFVCAYSLSKSFTMYGQRAGAMIAISQEKSVIDEFMAALQYSSRGTWSNCNSSGMNMLVHICENEELLKDIEKERQVYVTKLNQRADVFTKEADKVGLKYVPYVSGFFITVPVERSSEICATLEKENIFLVPMKNGVRVAVCSVSEKKMHGLALKLVETMEKLGINQ